MNCVKDGRCINCSKIKASCAMCATFTVVQHFLLLKYFRKAAQRSLGFRLFLAAKPQHEARALTILHLSYNFRFFGIHAFHTRGALLVNIDDDEKQHLCNVDLVYHPQAFMEVSWWDTVCAPLSDVGEVQGEESVPKCAYVLMVPV